MTVWSSFWRSQEALATIVTLYLLIGLGWAILIPPFEKPDEINHLAFIQLVASSGEWPSLRHPQTALVGWGRAAATGVYLAGQRRIGQREPWVYLPRIWARGWIA